MVKSLSTQPEEEIHGLGHPVLGRRVINHGRLLERRGYIMYEPVPGVAARAVVPINKTTTTVTTWTLRIRLKQYIVQRECV
jgi:hypothetical protein